MSSLATRALPYREALSVEPFRKFLIGQGLSMIGDAVCLAALPIALIRASFSGDVFGFIMAAVGAGTVIGALVGGVLADRKSPKRVLVYTDILRGALQVVATALIVAEAPWWSLLPVYLLFGAGIGVSRPCAQVLLVKLLPQQAFVAGNGAMNFVDNFVAIIFPATLGIVIILWNPAWGILLDGVTFFCAALFTMRLPDDGTYETQEKLSVREALNGIHVIRGNSVLILGFSATLIISVLAFPVFLVVAPYAISERFSDTMWGVCLAASGLGACLGSIITVLCAAHHRLTVLAVICTLILAAAMALLGIGSSAGIVILGAVFVGIVEASWLTGWATAMQMYSPEKELGKVVAVDTLLTSGTLPLIYLGGSVLGSIAGYPQTLLIVAVISAVGALLIALASIRPTSGGLER